MDDGVAFEIATPRGFTAPCSRHYWEFLAPFKHPVLAGQEDAVARTLADPDDVRCL